MRNRRRLNIAIFIGNIVCGIMLIIMFGVVYAHHLKLWLELWCSGFAAFSVAGAYISWGNIKLETPANKIPTFAVSASQKAIPILLQDL